MSSSKLSAANKWGPDDNGWHWAHYHAPYELGSKVPLFGQLQPELTEHLSPQPQQSPINRPGAHYEQQPPHRNHLAQLSCDTGEMILGLNFSSPFRGIVYPDQSRLSPCRFFGDGHHNYELRLPLRGCGTRQISARVFVNDVVVRFHKSLELEEDEVKTLICRYPPPLVPAPPDLAGNPISGGHQWRPTGSSEQETEQVPADRQRPNEKLMVAPDLPGLLAPSSNLTGGQVSGNQQQAGGLDSLSSVELLFLTSSLVFLLMLALCLGLGYCCFRRRATRGSKRRAGAILGRHRQLAGANQAAILGQSGWKQQHKLGFLAHQPHQHQHRLAQYPHLAGLSQPQRSGHSSSSPASERSHLCAPGAYLNASFAPDLLPEAPSDLGPRKAAPQTEPQQQQTVLGRRAMADNYQSARLVLHPSHYWRRQRASDEAHYGLSQASQTSPDREMALGYAPDDNGRHHSEQRHRLRNHSAYKQVKPDYGDYAGQQRLEKADGANGIAAVAEAAALAATSRLRSAKKPKIFLQSIEDSYFTQISETHQEEYMKRDSMQPLSLASWRSMQPGRPGSAHLRQHKHLHHPHHPHLNQQAQPQHQHQPKGTRPAEPASEHGSSSGASEPVPTLLGASSSSQDLLLGRHQHQQHSPSTLANLRSLTELDVNFSKSLLMLEPHLASSALSPLRPALSLGQLDSVADQGSHGSRPGQQVDRRAQKERATLFRSSSEQELADHQVRQWRISHELNEIAASARKQSPDLILSPDYDYSRLHLEPQNSSHNSISYA